jgi:hypothetical protein
MRRIKMGSGKFDSRAWTSYTKDTMDYDKKTTREIFGKRSMDAELNPYGVGVRESRDSADNPNSTALIVGLDVTGSMSYVIDRMAREGLNTLVTEIYNRKPIEDPHIMCAGIGDVECDSAPLQITQFEADIRIATQLEKIFLEGGGGGNSYESYSLVWYFAAMHTVTDCFEKRGKKGYIFTIGDEEPTGILTRESIKTFIGDGPQADFTSEELFNMASRQWEIFHVMVEQGSHFRYHGDRVVRKWTEILGQRALRLSDHTKMPELIVSVLQINEGADKKAVLESWDGTTSVVIAKGVGDLVSSGTVVNGGVVTL